MTLQTNFIHSWSRRALLVALGGIGGLALLQKFGGSAIAAEPAVTDITRRVIGALGHGTQLNVNRIAARTAAIEPLLAEIFSTTPALAEELHAAPEQVLRQRILNGIEADYLAGNLSIMNGWWISNTEARCLELIELVCC